MKEELPHMQKSQTNYKQLRMDGAIAWRFLRCQRLRLLVNFHRGTPSQLQQMQMGKRLMNKNKQILWMRSTSSCLNRISWAPLKRAKLWRACPQRRSPTSPSKIWSIQMNMRNKRRKKRQRLLVLMIKSRKANLRRSWEIQLSRNYSMGIMVRSTTQVVGAGAGNNNS